MVAVGNRHGRAVPQVAGVKAALHFDPSSRRSAHIARCMAIGIRACGDQAELIEGFDTEVRGDVIIAYGWRHPDLFEAYRQAGGHYVYVDLGWWSRKSADMILDGYHKAVVNGREPGPYFRRNSPPDRFGVHGQTILPWRRNGQHVIVAGMSAKSAMTRGLEPQQWERETIRTLQTLTPRPIFYRPKPSWADAKPIPGSTFNPGAKPISETLRFAWALVTLHSNAAIDALLAGVPVCCAQGVGSELSFPMEQIADPPLLDGRDQLMNDIAYVQWNGEEMRSGACWRHLRNEALG